eukprot:CAMPEP_0168597344 /NCGR_PEP_ID=MMETSP0420-20121227/10604_1 /TAXON_ID=498008 /ORGANISM="Pessonella sp." /LENGTH=88 /DNA_ID=CAMNT_0008634169 /DNA_START=18 /DNA_END=280 /DNA_ORIENTATION=+
MTDIGSSPRVNAATLAQYAGKLVRVVGKVVQQQNGTGVLQTSDGGSINVTNVTEAWTDQFVEVIGMVQSADTVQAQTSKSFGNNFDFT